MSKHWNKRQEMKKNKPQADLIPGMPPFSNYTMRWNLREKRWAWDQNNTISFARTEERKNWSFSPFCLFFSSSRLFMMLRSSSFLFSSMLLSLFKAMILSCSSLQEFWSKFPGFNWLLPHNFFVSGESFPSTKTKKDKHWTNEGSLWIFFLSFEFHRYGMMLTSEA